MTGQEQSWSRSSVTVERAAKELLRRIDAAEDLIKFTEYTFRAYQTAEIHRIIASQLERVEQGEVDRLMLHVPPRHGKSELASRRFPAYYLGKHPERQFISASAGVTLAEDFGRDVRNIIAGPQYACLFDTRLAEDSQARSGLNVGVGVALPGQ